MKSIIHKVTDYKIIKDLFQKIGFSNYETLIIVELYGRGPSKADDLAKWSGVPLARVYETLDTLSSKKFVNVSNSRPRIYTAENPQVAIKQLLSQKRTIMENQIKNYVSDSNSLLENIQPIYFKKHTQITPDELLSQFSTMKEAEDYTLKLIRSAKKEILIFTHVFNWYQLVKPELINAINNGCIVKILMQTEYSMVKNKIDDMRNYGMHVKTAPKRGIMSRGTIIDGNAMLFIIWANEEMDKDKNLSKRVYNPHYSSNKGIVEVFYLYFNYLWNQKN